MRPVSALQENIKKLKEAARERNPRAAVVVTDSVITVEHPELIEGKKVVTIDDGPTLTHGGMPYGAGAPAVYRGDFTPRSMRVQSGPCLVVGSST